VSVLKPGDLVLGMSLAHGGHLTHGSPVNFSGKIYDFIGYGLDENEEIDYLEIERLAHEKKPKMIVAGASAYSLIIDWERIGKIAKECGSYFVVDMAHYAGLVAAKLYPTPVGVADFVTSTTHKTLRGPRGGLILANSEHEKAMNSSIFPGNQGGPLMHVIAGKAVAFKEAMEPSFVEYQKQVLINAKLMAETLSERGVRIVSGKTESHVFLVDLRVKGLTGKEAEKVLGDAHITVNKNAIPNDPESPFVTSGIRIGSPAMTTRGFKDQEAVLLAHLIADVLDSPTDTSVIQQVRGKITELCSKLPVYTG
jgi:glycine hydroxymethyltransferase